jgi:Zn-dependent peptidase ImmA (M78 family)
MRPEDYARSLYHLLDMGKMPIDLELFWKRFGIVVKRINLELVSGIIIKDRELPLIAVNKNMGLARIRFTLAHELGHFILPHNRSVFSCQESQMDRWEQEANRFAAELLMPQPLIKRLWGRYKDNPEHRLEIVAEKLQVSQQALNIRLRQMGVL